jgi:hypothetical protein
LEHDGGVKRLDRLNLDQRIIIVIALGGLMYWLGIWISSLNKPTAFGWVAYAPLSGSTFPPIGGLTPRWILLLWTGLTLVWAILSMVVLRSPRRDRYGLDESE